MTLLEHNMIFFLSIIWLISKMYIFQGDNRDELWKRGRRYGPKHKFIVNSSWQATLNKLDETTTQKNSHIHNNRSKRVNKGFIQLNQKVQFMLIFSVWWQFFISPICVNSIWLISWGSHCKQWKCQQATAKS